METNKWLPVSIYRFILTVARRTGAESIKIRAIVTDGAEIAVLRTRGEKYHLLPYYNIEEDAEGEDVENAIKEIIGNAGLDISCISRYLGNKNANCFYFEVLVKKKKTRNIIWVNKDELDKLNIPEEENKVLKAYFAENTNCYNKFRANK